MIADAVASIASQNHQQRRDLTSYPSDIRKNDQLLKRSKQKKHREALEGFHQNSEVWIISQEQRFPILMLIISHLFLRFPLNKLDVPTSTSKLLFLSRAAINIAIAAA